ncbi:MAG: GNAT family N-acetyltransferase [Ferruginibacter sp.]
MTGKLKISTLLNEEIPTLVSLVNSAYRGESAKQGWTTEADLLDGIRTDRESIKELTGKTGSTIFVAHDETNRMVGCVYLHKEKTSIYLGMLTVAPDIQAKGIGKKLLATAEAHTKTVNCDRIVMSVIDIRHELIAWYERHGYLSTGETKPFPADPAFGLPRQPLQFIIMEKIID